MFKFEGKSPAEQFSNLVKIWLLFMIVTFGSIDVEYEQREWEREQEQKERDAKWTAKWGNM